jgi:beta-glucanase (GH16 family)
MKKKSCLFLFSLFILRGVFAQNITSIIPLDTIENQKTKANWNLIFHDEFDGDTLNTGLWWVQNELHRDSVVYFRNSKDNIFLKDGQLCIRAIKDSFKRAPYTSGLLYSAPKFSKGTLAEIRCRIPKGRGLWPAFWFWKGGWDSTYQELDVFEFWCHNTDRFCISNHYWDKKKKTVSTEFKWIRPRTPEGNIIDMSKEFLTYSVYWDDSGIKVLLNNRLVSQIKDNIPKDSFSLILNLGVDKGKGKPNKNTIFPADFIIDYVRVYKKLSVNADSK